MDKEWFLIKPVNVLVDTSVDSHVYDNEDNYEELNFVNEAQGKRRWTVDVVKMKNCYKMSPIHCIKDIYDLR